MATPDAAAPAPTNASDENAQPPAGSPMKAAPELTPEEAAKAERKAKAEAALKKQKEELLARKAAKKAAAAGGATSSGATSSAGTTSTDGSASPEGPPRGRVSSATRRRATGFVKPDAVPDAHDMLSAEEIAEMEKNEGVKEGSGRSKPPMERRGTGFVNKQQVAAHIAANDAAEPKKRSSMCTLS